MTTERLATASCALGILAYVGLSHLVGEAPAAADPPAGMEAVPDHEPLPRRVDLTGIVRDFREAHPDFGVVPDGDYGHDAGLVAPRLNGLGRPAFTGTGVRVVREWVQAAERPVAPHLHAAGGRTIVALAVAPEISPGAILDSWDSSLGPYDAAIAGPAPDFTTGAAAPPIFSAGDLGPSVGEMTGWPAGTIPIDQDFRCDRFVVTGSTTVEIAGDVTILCEQEFRLAGQARLRLAPGASLSLYVAGAAVVGGAAEVNAAGDPRRLRLCNIGAADVHLQDSADFCGRVVSPSGRLELSGPSSFSGTFAGRAVALGEGSAFHLDVAPAADACGALLADAPGETGPPSNAGISSAQTFDEWFRDVAEVNLSQALAFPLVRGAGGMLEYVNPEFFPVDSQLFGNEGRPRNTLFTFALETSFVYRACTGQTLALESSGDLWVFIDGNLVVDLGGVQTAGAQSLDLDRLELTDGAEYPLALFFAQRHEGPSALALRTNVAFLAGEQVATLTAPFD